MPRDDRGSDRKLSELHDRWAARLCCLTGACASAENSKSSVPLPTLRVARACRLRACPFRKTDASTHLQTSRALLAFAEAVGCLPAGRKTKCAGLPRSDVVSFPVLLS